MKLINLTEAKAKRQGISTPNAVVEELADDIKNGNVKHVVCVTQNSDDTVTISCDSMEQTQSIGLLECSKQLILNDMFD